MLTLYFYLSNRKKQHDITQFTPFGMQCVAYRSRLIPIGGARTGRAVQLHYRSFLEIKCVK